MATDDTSLILSISADVRQLSRALKRMESDTSRSTRAVEKQFDDMGKNVESRVNKLGTSITGAIKNFGTGLASGLAGGLSVQQFVRFTDGATRITNALKVAGLEGKNLAETYERLGKIALANGASFESVANLYAKVSQNAKQLGVTSQQAEEFTRRIAVGLRASGTDASAASAGIMQLNQALASGVLRGDEFNSVAENLPVVAKAIADGLGVTVGKLREMAADGALDAKTVFDAFIKGSEGLDAQAAKTSATFSQAFENISTALTIAAGKFNETTGASRGFAAAVDEYVIPSIEKFGIAVDNIGDLFDRLLGGNAGTFASWLKENAASSDVLLDALNGLKPGLGDLIRLLTTPNVFNGEGITQPLVAAFKDAQEQVKAFRTGLAADIQGIFGDYEAALQSLRDAGQADVASGIEAEFERINQKVKDGTFTIADFDSAIAKLADTGDAASIKLAEQLSVIQGKFKDAGVSAQQSIGDAEKAFNDAGKALADALGSSAIATVDALASRFSSAMPDAVGRFTSALREAVGLMSRMNESAATINGQLSSLGSLGPITSEGGEFRFPATDLKDWNDQGEAAGEQWMSGLYGYLRSGQARSHVDNLNKDFASRLNSFLQASPDRIEITSGARTVERQAELWQQALAKYGSASEARKWVAPPGRSNHNSGSAADLGFSSDAARSWAHQNAGAFGLNFRLGNEPWHIEMAAAGEQSIATAKEATDAWQGLRAATVETADATQTALQTQQEWGDLASTAINGIANALQDGKITAQEWLQIGVQIIQQLLQMKSLGGGMGGGGGGGLLGGLFGGGGGGGGLLGGLIIPGILHKGGVAGVDGYDHSRAVPSSVFAGARKFHKGLMPDEFPAILQRGETVIPRGGFQGGGQQPMGIADVRVYMDDNGKWQAEVERISQKEARQATRAGITQYDKQVDRTFGSRMANAQARQL